MREIIARDGDRMAAFIVELVQGEAGFVTAPRDFFVPLFDECRRAGIAIWIDEVQTFARTGELFATTRLALEDYANVITIGKVFQGSALLHRSSFAPDPALISGTYAGATVPMAVATRMIERLTTERHLRAGRARDAVGAADPRASRTDCDRRIPARLRRSTGSAR